MKKIITLLLFFIVTSIFSQNISYSDEVKIKNGITYLNNVPYTGIVYKDSPLTSNECNCLLKENYTKGMLNGKKEEWYNNGKLKYSGFYNNDTPIGTHLEYSLYGFVDFEKEYKNGVLLKSINRTNKILFKESMFYYLDIRNESVESMKISEKLLHRYLSKYDSDYSSYKSNEFEIKRKLSSAKKEIKNNIRKIDYNRRFKHQSYTNLSKYFFEEKSYNVNMGRLKGSIFFYDIPSIHFINANDFTELKMNPSKAESLRNEIKDYVYYTFEYKILSKDEFDYSMERNTKAYITKVIYYSDKEYSNQVYIIDKSKELLRYIEKYKSDKQKKNTLINTTTNINKPISNHVKVKYLGPISNSKKTSPITKSKSKHKATNTRTIRSKTRKETSSRTVRRKSTINYKGASIKKSLIINITERMLVKIRNTKNSRYFEISPNQFINKSSRGHSYYQTDYKLKPGNYILELYHVKGSRKFILYKKIKFQISNTIGYTYNDIHRISKKSNRNKSSKRRRLRNNRRKSNKSYNDAYKRGIREYNKTRKKYR